MWTGNTQAVKDIVLWFHLLHWLTKASFVIPTCVLHAPSVLLRNKGFKCLRVQFTSMHARSIRGPHVIVRVETFNCHCTLTGIFPSFSSFAVIACLMSYTLVSCTRPTRATLQNGSANNGTFHSTLWCFHPECGTANHNAASNCKSWRRQFRHWVQMKCSKSCACIEVTPFLCKVQWMVHGY